jgi:hypothetical protein
VPPRNPAALAQACIQLLRDDKLRQTMGAAARARAVEHFTVDRAISAFDEMYTLLGGVPAAAGVADAALETAAGAGPQADVPAAEARTATQPNRWIVLPPEEECTVVMPRTELSVKAAARPPVRPPVRPEEEITQVVPVFGGGLAGADPDSTVILPRQRRGWIDPADEDRTVIMPRQIREYGAPPETAAPQAPAGPSADELTEAAR